MTILYEGSQSNFIGIFFYVMAAFLAVILITIAICTKEPKVLLGLLASVIFVLGGFLSSLDTGYPIVKATLNDTVPYVEIVEHYEYISREGDLWTFRVLEEKEE